MENNLNSVENAIENLKDGKIILVVDDFDRENEVDMICAGEFATPENINYMATYAKGLICTPVSEEIANSLNLYPMEKNNMDNHETAFTRSIDFKDSKTGISAFERSQTIINMIKFSNKPDLFRSPGHVFPLKSKKGGLLVRRGHTEATIDLMKLSKLNEVGVCCEIMDEDGHMLNGDKINTFAIKHNLVLISIQDIVEFIKKKF